MNDGYHDGSKEISGYALGFFTWVISAGVMSVYFIPGIIYREGLGGAWFAIAIGFGLFLSWTLASYRLMLYATKERNIHVLTEYMDERFRKRSISGILIRIAVGVYLLTIMAYTSSILYTFINTIYPGRGLVIVLLLFLIVNVFTIAFGLSGTAYISTVKGVFILAAMMLLIFTIWLKLGRDGLLHGLFLSRPEGGMTKFLDARYVSGKAVTVNYIISELSWLFIVIGTPNILNLYMAYGNTKDLAKGRNVTIVFSVFALFESGVLGVFLRAFLGDGRIEMRNLSTVMLFKETFAKLGSDNTLGGWVRMIYIIAVVFAASAVMDSCLHFITSSILSPRGWIMHVIGRRKNERGIIAVASTGILTLVLILGVLMERAVTSLPQMVIMITGCIIYPAVFGAIFDRRINDIGTAFGVIAGGFTPFVWKYAYLINYHGEWQTLQEFTEISGIIPAVVLSILSMIIVSRLSKDVDESVKAEFDEVKKHIDN